MSLSSETTGYLHQEVLKNARYLVVTVDRHGLVAKQDCPGIRWRMDGLKTGRSLPDNLEGIVAAAEGSTTPQLFPYVQLTDSLFADVHVLNRGEEKQLILQDVSEGHTDEYKLQQKAHEVSLLLEQQGELNRELAEKKLEAERASQAKSRFIASMSHEFRSPIAAIMGHAELLVKEMPGAEGPEAIKNACWHLLTLVENLLEHARADEGVLSLNSAPVRTARVLGDMRELFAGQASGKGLELEVEIPESDPLIETDEIRLRQVLINLLSNAIRFTDDGKVRLACREDGNRLEFVVSDTGRGIAEEDLERVFEAFTRLDGGGVGSGLGLTISDQLVNAMGGKLTLESEPGTGSTCRFSLALQPATEPENETDLAGVSILLVEDDADLREMYRIFLEDWGARVTAVPGYRSALDAYRSNPVDLVIADYSLTDGLGTRLLSELRKADGYIRTVLCSGAGCRADGSPLDPDSADVCIVKPVAADFLRSVVTRLVQKENGA